ncbi:hypothetical protein [Microbacterium sp. 179-I 3D4 NHS]|uniref:hypothetical protein n=1 Tax=Microbacterium sp. 179-I 3D4 NHS TaxID=3142381 RepID=UPI00399EFA16
MTGCDVVAMWPELFVGMDEKTRDSYRQTFAMTYLAGWEPERAAVENLLSYERGDYDHAEYLRRAHEHATQQHPAAS